MNQIISKEYFTNSERIPEKLFLLGDLGNKTLKRISIVGSRRPSLYGRMAIERIISGAKGYPVSIISGLAIGLDTMAHDLAIKNGLHTIAIPGSGLEKSILYPRTNTELANRIIESGGALLSIWDKQPAAPWTFPVRNSVMAGISDFVLIIEAEIDSGTMITAREAIKRNVLLGAIPGSIDSIFSSGPNNLIKNGAFCITTFDDIVKLIGLRIEDKKKKVIQNEDSLFQYLTEPIHKDALATLSKMSVSDLNIELTMMEISGDITIDSSGMIRIT